MAKDLEQQAEELHQVITDLVKKYQFRDRHEICCYGVSVSQCYALEALDLGGTLTMGELARHMHLTVSTMTRVVDQLVAKELVHRWFGPEDRRVCCVELTKPGRSLLKKIKSELLDTEKEILRKINPEDRETLIFALRELSKAVDHWREKACCST
jgi:DNA-binding MarR family transcriptional regulator